MVRYVGAWDMPLSAAGHCPLPGGSAVQALRAVGRARSSWLSVAEIKDAADWDGALRTLPAAHILQSWAWTETKAQTGWRAQRLLWTADGEPAAAAAFLLAPPERRSAGRRRLRAEGPGAGLE